MMLVHIDQADIAERVHNAWLRTIEDGVHTYDIFKEGVSKEKVGTREFAQAVVDRLGQMPQTLKPVKYNADADKVLSTHGAALSAETKETVGVDVFLDWTAGTPDELAAKLAPVAGDLKLTVIHNRGIKVWPEGLPETFCSDHWRCRFTAQDGTGAIKHAQIAALLQRMAAAGLDFIKTENLCTFAGQPGFSV
jgi:isocitrate dehydrogenase